MFAYSLNCCNITGITQQFFIMTVHHKQILSLKTSMYCYNFFKSRKAQYLLHLWLVTNIWIASVVRLPVENIISSLSTNFFELRPHPCKSTTISSSLECSYEKWARLSAFSCISEGDPQASPVLFTYLLNSPSMNSYTVTYSFSSITPK